MSIKITKDKQVRYVKEIYVSDYVDNGWVIEKDLENTSAVKAKTTAKKVEAFNEQGDQ
jgi:hypothetical protein